MGSIIFKIIMVIVAILVGANDFKTMIKCYKKEDYFWAGFNLMFLVYWAAIVFATGLKVINDF